MAVSREFSTLETLLEWETECAKDREILERIKKLAAIYLPDGWRQWKVVPLTKEELLGEDLDPQILNKIRFCLPTVELARAFCPNGTSLSEKQYKDMKIKMLGWPFCVGLIVGPPSVGARIRGSAVQNELIIASLADLKPLLLSRKDASKELAENEEDDVSTVRSSSSKSKSKLSRMDKLEEEFSEMKDMLSGFIKRFEPVSDHESEPDESYTSSEEELVDKQHLRKPDSIEWKAPSPVLEDENDDFDFSPQTKEQEPAIPTPKPHIELQGIQCLRLGELAYKQIRYAEVQKKLQAFPVFHALKLNPALMKINQSSASADPLAKQEASFGTILHGLLLQREALTNIMKDLSSKHPSLKQDLKESLYGENSAFKSISDDVLQYVCGRKAELIEQRRNACLPQDDYHSTLLNHIPPSSTHLFDENQFSELLKQPSLQGFFRGSTASSYKSKFQPKAGSGFEQRKRIPKSSRASFKPRPQQSKPSNSESWKPKSKRASKRSFNGRPRDKSATYKETDTKKPRRS